MTVALPVCGVLLFALPFVTWAYDETHVLTLTCTVESVRGTISDSHLRRGGSFRAVVIETKGCGTLVLTGVGRDDYVEVTQSISTHPGRYDFVVGESGWALCDHWTAFGSAPRMKAYERVE